MKSDIYRLLILVGAAVAASCAFAETPEQVAARTLIVGADKGVSAGPHLMIPQGAQIIKTIPRIGAQVIRFPSKAMADSMVAVYKRTNGVRYVEHDGVQRALGGFPNDPYYYRQWSHNRTNTNFGWGMSTGSPDITVAVIDTGIDLNHPEFAGRIVNPVALVAPTVRDGNGHGTHCSGIASAAGNNGIGVAGVSWLSKIMPIKALYDEGYGFDSDLTEAMVIATDAGANVVSYSVGGYNTTVPQEYLDAIDYMHSHNVVFCAASGNDGVNLDTLPVLYGLEEVPCSYAPTFSVASSNSMNRMSGFSNYGQTVDITAPGEKIMSTFPNGYGYDTGTSMACPYIAGVSALIFSLGGTSMPYQDVEDLITSTSFPYPSGASHGLVNTMMAMRALPIDDNFDLVPADLSVLYGSVTTGDVSSLAVKDDTYLGVQAVPVAYYGPTVVFDTTYYLGDITHISSMYLKNYVKTDAPVNATLNLWDPHRLAWVPFSSKLINGGEVDMASWIYQSDLAKYTDNNGVLKVRFSGFGRLRRFGTDNPATFTVSADAQGLRVFSR